MNNDVSKLSATCILKSYHVFPDALMVSEKQVGINANKRISPDLATALVMWLSLVFLKILCAFEDTARMQNLFP